MAKLAAPSGSHAWSEAYGDDTLGDIFGPENFVKANGSGQLCAAGKYVESVDLGGGVLDVANGDTYFASFDADSSHLWSSNHDVDAVGLAINDAAECVMSGTVNGNVDFGGGNLPAAGGRDIFVVKRNADGVHLWSKRFGDSADQGIAFTSVAADGSVFVFGRRGDGNIDFGGTPLNNYLYLVKLAR